MDKILRHPRLILAAAALISIFFGAQLPNLRMDNNNLRFVPTDDKARVVSAWIDETFGSSLFILIGLERKTGTVLDADFLRQIQAFADDIEQIETVDDVNSIMTTDYIRGEDDAIIVGNLVPDDWSGAADEIAALKERLLSWDMYDRSLVSDDWRSTQIYVPLNVDAENAGDPAVIASFLQIRDKAREMFKDYATVYVAGMPVISGTINESMGADLRHLIPIVILVVLIIVYLPLRNWFFVFLSMLAVLLATVWAMGAMPLLHIRLSIIISVLPVVLIAVGNSYGLHVIIHYIKLSEKDFGSMSREEHTQYVIDLMKLVRRPIFLASITTLASFLSFCFTKVLPIREFGYFSAFGVFASFVLSIFVTPAILILRGPKALKSVKPASLNTARSMRPMLNSESLSRFFVRITQKHIPVLLVAAIVILISIYGSTKLVTDNIFVEYFKKTTDIVRSDKFIRDNFGGSKIISIVMEADTSQELMHPDSLIAVDNLHAFLAGKVPAVGKIMGFTDLIKRTNEIFYNEGPSYYEIPADPERYGKQNKDDLQRLISNYLILISSNSNAYSNDPLEPTAIKSTVQLRTLGQIDTDAAVQKINQFVAENFPKNIKVTIGGAALVEGSTNKRVVQSVWSSIFIAFVSLFFIVSFFNKSLLAGLIGVLPLASLVLLNFAVMGFFGIKLNIATAMIASLTMGIGIDYTVHFMEAYKREFKKTGGSGDFLFNAYRTSGSAIIADAVSTGLGFSVLLFSQFVMLAEFGLLVAVSLLMSALVGLVLVPALMDWIKPKFVLNSKD